jgi:hypothetical protein
VAVAIMTQYVWHTGLPFWGLFITLALAAIYVIPVGTVYAVANLNSNVLTVLGEIISGYTLKGKPLVLLIFKVNHTTLVITNSRLRFYSSTHTPD